MQPSEADINENNMADFNTQKTHGHPLAAYQRSQDGTGFASQDKGPGKKRYDELSSLHPSPKLKPNPHLNLDALEKEAIGVKEPVKKDLNESLREMLGNQGAEPRLKNEQSVASSMADYMEATQLLRKMSGNYRRDSMMDYTQNLPLDKMHSLDSQNYNKDFRHLQRGPEDSLPILPYEHDRYAPELRERSRDFEREFSDPRMLMAQDPREHSDVYR